MKPAQLAQLAFIFAAAAAVYFFVSTVQDAEARDSCTPLCALRPAYAHHNRSVPDFELPDLKGNRVRFSSYRGKTVILNFWTKTCRPCLEEMPSISELAQLARAEGVAEVVTITTDESADSARATLAAVLGQQDPPFTVLVDPDARVVGDMFGTRLYPETWFIDPSGVIRARVDGARDWSSSLVLDVARMVSRKSGGCGITFDRGKPRGDRRGICESTPGMPEE